MRIIHIFLLRNYEMTREVTGVVEVVMEVV